ncbi:TonB family protein [Pleionea sp. CnH1-48]|uniref:TonB family protein n=1 Tax=Pleionea sp. CnH1-48 TaxID=2954494 RepID=UPI002097E942|nr:TonB family protein [Pleionea sp. CnH1-48]MCO7227234.1 TonB family protein [Pleionea sp. CnH1-48]
MKNLCCGLLLFTSSMASADFFSALDAYENKQYPQAFTEFKPLAEIGEARSQSNLGVMYYHGQHVSKDINLAYAWARLGAENESATDTQKNVFKAISKEVKDKAAAEAAFQTLAAKYSGKALLNSLYPVLVEPSKKSSFQAKPIRIVEPKYPRKAAMEGIAGWVKLSFDLDKKGNPRNIRIKESFPSKIFNKGTMKAVSRWRFEPRLNKKGQAIEALNIAYTLSYNLSNHSIISDEYYADISTKAYSGDPNSQLILGLLHESFPNDVKKKENPTEWYLKAARQGVPTAQFKLGESLIYGKGCASDKEKGIDWLTRAASSHQSDAKELLAGLAAQNKSKASHLQAAQYIKELKEMTPTSKIRFAWLFATSPFSEVTNPQKAIELVESISRRDYRNEVTKYEILAAAHAAMGDFDKAVDYQEDALDEAEDLDFSAEEIKQRLTAYQQNKRWF